MIAEATQLLQTRLLVPRPPRHALLRPRLAALLAAPEARLVLLSAPAGFGKTTLLAGWCRDLAAEGVAVAWLTLEAGDNDPQRFLAYLRAALAPLAGAPPDPGPPPGGEAGPAAEPALTPLLNALAGLDHGAVLVLDDYHVIHEPAVHLAVAFLLEHLPPQVRLALGSRADPPLALARLRVRGQLAELRAADLRFTREELAAFFAGAGLALPPEDLAAVDAYVEGWPAGGQLVALARRLAPGAGGPAGAPAARPLPPLLAVSQPHLFAYLAEDVFACQPAHRKAFLLQTSILDLLYGPLCDAVLGVAAGPANDSYSQILLDELEHANLFVSAVDGERRWFRTHQLFRAFLRERLAHEPPEQVALLHRRASDWYAAGGQLGAAAEHALAAGAEARAAELIAEEAVALVARGEHGTLRAWLARLPEPLRDERLTLQLDDQGLARRAVAALAALDGHGPQQGEGAGAPLPPADLAPQAEAQQPEGLPEALSEREREVLALVARGASNQAIADALVLSVGTVKSHLNHILGKLGARSRTEAVAFAREHGLLP